MNGIILVYKPKGYTSRDIVNIVVKHLNTKKVGHAGTLDPMAEGVLIICVGKATKLVELFTGHDKEYVAEITLGLKTDTFDITGEVLKKEKVLLKKEEIIGAVNSMIGNYEQQVPIYSAVKVKGKKLYEYARKNEEVNLPKRMVNIKSIKLIDDIKYINNKTVFKIKCLVSKGTYIRSLVNDIADKLNTIGVLSALTRVKQGGITIDKCITIDDIKNNNYSLINIRDVLLGIKQVYVDEQQEKDILNGKILVNNYDAKEILFINDKEEVLSIYHEYKEDKTKIKPWKMLK